MHTETIVEQLFNHLVNGDRARTRQFVGRVLTEGMTPAEFAGEVVWRLQETLFKLNRADQIAPLAFNYATRLLRSLTDQLQAGYQQSPRRGAEVLLFSGREEIEDLGGQIAADLLEADGWDVRFGGPMVATDDILAEVHARRPKWLVLFCSHPKDVAPIRALIDTLRDINAHPDLRVAVGGGVFNRASGLAEEMGAIHAASTPIQLVELLAGRTKSDADAMRASETARGVESSDGRTKRLAAVRSALDRARSDGSTSESPRLRKSA